MSAGWLEILIVAFGAQLAVLPGEKGQFVVAALATRYHPLLVVSAAGAAFGGWTALEIALGSALKSAVPPILLEAFTAALFLLFAVLLYRSRPPATGRELDASRESGIEADGGIGVAAGRDPTVLGRELPEPVGGFVSIFGLMAAGEFGDKTQLITIGLASQYGASSAIWVGEMLAIIPVSLLNAYFFHRFSHRFDARKAHLAGAALFAFFGLDTVLAIATGVSVWETAVEYAADAVVAAV